ncbi:lectin-like protein [Oceanipulchritudo coccoides]|nr:lectin-like protein [Oceanipulchritudo coccoides]
MESAPFLSTFDNRYIGHVDLQILLGIGGAETVQLIFNGFPPIPDTDGDGLDDEEETNYGTDPNDPDTDGDGLNDFDELFLYETNPLLADSDGDGIDDRTELGLNRFNLIVGSFTWGQAKVDAEANDGHLATFTSQGEWDIAMESIGAGALDSISGAWIGANDIDTEGNWTWVTGEPFTFELWALGQPDDFNNSDVAEVSGGFGASIGEWFDTGLTVTREAYIIESAVLTDPTLSDSDDDGLDDGVEIALGTDPNDADTDDDGLADGDEQTKSLTNPLLADSDNNGTADSDEDFDGDGLTTGVEVNTYGTDPRLKDTDGDQIGDGDEVNLLLTDPTLQDSDDDGTLDGLEDFDGDGLTNLDELSTHLTDPTLADTDGDFLTDGQEINQTLTNPLLEDSDENGTNDNLEDLDGDNLSNFDELNLYRTNPALADTDGDSLADDFEVSYNDSLFYVIEGALTYSQAEADANIRGGRVASFLDGSEYTDFVLQLRQVVSGNFWISLTDSVTEGSWIWGDGTALNYNRWYSGQPDGGMFESNVVILSDTASWADSNSEFVADGYIFEFVGLNPNESDTDGDGLEDAEELNTHSTDPLGWDSDQDGLSDGDEVNIHGSDPLLIDTDEDGLDDYTEVVVYASNPNSQDSDGDGFLDKFEVESGFDPTSDTSVPGAFAEIYPAVEFTFNAVLGVTYQIEKSTDLNTWTVLEAGIPGNGSSISRFYQSRTGDKQFYRAGPEE